MSKFQELVTAVENARRLQLDHQSLAGAVLKRVYLEFLEYIDYQGIDYRQKFENDLSRLMSQKPLPNGKTQLNVAFSFGRETVETPISATVIAEQNTKWVVLTFFGITKVIQTKVDYGKDGNHEYFGLIVKKIPDCEFKSPTVHSGPPVGMPARH